MKDELDKIKQVAKDLISKASAVAELENIRVNFLGKKGSITEILRNLKNLDLELRKAIGEESNKLKEHLEEIITERINHIKQKEVNERIMLNRIDVTLPPKGFNSGSLHPVTIVQKEIEKIFSVLGFMIADGPEIETEFFNFEALNVPAIHPARDMQDTYWMENGQVLRTQTSAVQGRIMKMYKPPLRVIAPGRCFRNEALDACHENTFFQLEGMMIDKDISIANLIYFMKLLLTKVFDRDDIKLRLRPGYFPFVEPGFELDLNCLICGGIGCPTCKHSGWMELLPCGMIHPNVLKCGGIDPEEYTGFAFGLGLTRLAMMKYGIKDIRVLNSGDLRALKQIGIR